MKVLLTILLSVVLLPCFSQSKLDTRPLLYRSFISGDAMMKSGAVEKAEFNYNTNNQSIVFFDGKRMLELTDLSNIDKVVLNKTTFKPVGGKFYETTPYSNLLVSYSNKKTPKTKTVEKDGVAQVEIAVSNNDISNTSLIKRYDDVMGLSYVRSFWLLESGKLKSINTIKEIANVVGSDKENVTGFVKKNKLNINDADALKKILEHWSK